MLICFILCGVKGIRTLFDTCNIYGDVGRNAGLVSVLNDDDFQTPII